MLVRAHHTFPSRISGSFLLRNGKLQITKGLFRPPTIATYTGTAELIASLHVSSHTPPRYVRVKFQEIISLSTLHIYYTLNFPKIQILFSLSHSVFSHLRNLQAGRFGVETQESNSL